MFSLEVRYASMVLINILKSLIDDQSWDAFGVMSSWNKFSTLSLLFFLLSFYSIKIPLSSTHLQIQSRFHNFNPIVFISLFFTLILPQRACWPCFVVAWLLSYETFPALVGAFINCFEAILCRIPGYNIGATTIDRVDELVVADDLERGTAANEEDEL